VEARNSIGVASFLLGVGLRHSDSIALEFVRASFEIVYDAAAKEKVDYEYWRPIEQIAPAVSSWREWDKCERMRIALIERFMRHDWPSVELFRTVKSGAILEEVFTLFNTTRARKRFLKRSARIGLELALPDDCRKVLERYS